MTIALRDGADGVSFPVLVVPGSSRVRIAGAHGDALKVQLTAPPEGGRANDQLLEVLAEALAVPLRCVAVRSGASSRRKLVHVQGCSSAAARARLHLP